MKNINFIKITLDILMVLVFVLLFNKLAIVPMTFHEIAGLLIGAIVIIHIALNFKWVKQVTLKLFNSKINLRAKFGYIIDALLLLCFVVIIISGILISHILFPNAKINSSINFRAIHISISYVALLLVGIHVGLHWNWAINVFKNIFGIRSKKQIFSIIAKLAVVLLFIFGSYNIYSARFFSQVSAIATSFNGSQPNMQDGDMSKAHQNGQMWEHPMQNGTQSGGESSKGVDGQAQMQQSAQHGSGAPEGGNSFASPNVFQIITTYASIISVFSIITFYLDKILVRRKVEK